MGIEKGALWTCDRCAIDEFYHNDRSPPTGWKQCSVSIGQVNAEIRHGVFCGGCVAALVEVVAAIKTNREKEMTDQDARAAE